jgi:hypothetical protein
MSDDERDDEMELVMPFVTVASVGGVHDDGSYVAGWEMGALDVTLQNNPLFHEQMILTENAPQVDLLAMKNGYRPEIVRINENWSSFTATRLESTASPS